MKRMLTSSLAAVVLSLFGVSAGATVSVNLVASGPFSPGSLITLKTFVTANGGEEDSAVIGAIDYPDALVNSNLAGNSQVLLPGFNWHLGPMTCSTTPSTTSCIAFAQFNASSPITVNLTDFQLAITTFIIDATTPVGSVINFEWETASATQRFVWFGLTNAPGVSITVIPEPETAALLALGLLGLAVAARRPL
jgi:hypothetical protein